jgi:nitrogen fixation NifU-like protein
MRLEQIYQDVILDHYKHPQHRGLREPFGAQVYHLNPVCGDEVTLRVALSDDGEHIADVSYDGQGCSISQAATSVLTEQVIGQSVGQAIKIVTAFTEMVSSRGTVAGDEDVLGDGIAFAGVAKYPARVKCALLGWMAFKDALAQASAEKHALAQATGDFEEVKMSETAAPDNELLADIEEAMRDVVDPELGINVVDLGLVYGLNLEEGEEGTVALIDMTLTSPACPLTDVIEDQSRSALIGTGLVDELRINWVWNPPWGPDKITDDGRDQLRALGFTV